MVTEELLRTLEDMGKGITECLHNLLIIATSTDKEVLANAQEEFESGFLLISDSTNTIKEAKETLLAGKK